MKCDRLSLGEREILKSSLGLEQHPALNGIRTAMATATKVSKIKERPTTPASPTTKSRIQFSFPSYYSFSSPFC
jgi:hypothetical protein